MAKHKPIAKQLSEEEALLYEQHQLSYEQLLHLMFCNPEWEQKYPRRNKKRLRVLAYCLYYYGITSSQLLSTGATPLSNTGAERTYLSRMKNAGLLRPVVHSQPSEYITVFFLTAKGADLGREELLEMNREIGSPVSDACIEYIYRRFKKFTDAISLGHFLGIRDLGAYLLSSFTERPFCYRLECGIYIGGGRMRIAESLRGGLFGAKRKQIAMICDALLDYPASMPAALDALPALSPAPQTPSAMAPQTDNENTNGWDNLRQMIRPYVNDSPAVCHVYVEQDMVTQRRKVIISKILNYVQNVAAVSACPALETLLFSVLTPNTELREADPYRRLENRSISSHAALSSVPIVAYLLYGELWRGATVSSLTAEYEKIVGHVTCFDTKYGNTLALLKELANGSPERTIGEVFDGLGDTERSAKAEREHIYRDYHRKRYLLRKETLRSAIDQLPELSDIFLSGFSIGVTHNRTHDAILPFLFPVPHRGTAESIKALANRYFGTDFDQYGTYESFSISGNSHSFVLRNHFYWKDGTHLYAENLSDDFGGTARVRHYLSAMEWNGEEGYLIGLLADDDAATLKELASCAYYMQTQEERMGLPLQVYYITYSGFKQAQGLSFYDPERDCLCPLSLHIIRMGES